MINKFCRWSWARGRVRGTEQLSLIVLLDRHRQIMNVVSLSFSPFAMAIRLALPLVDINWTNLVYNFVYPIYHCGELLNLVTCTIERWSWQIFDLVFPNCYATALGRRPLCRPLSAFPALCAVRREQIPLEPALHACLCLLSSLYNVIIWPTITGCRWVFLPWLHT